MATSTNKKSIAKTVHDIVLFPVYAPVNFIHKKIKPLPVVHKRTTHIIIGFIFATGGVCLVKFTHTTLMPLHVFIDIVGYFIHGIGLAPLGKEVFAWIGYNESDDEIKNKPKIKKEEGQT